MTINPVRCCDCLCFVRDTVGDGSGIGNCLKYMKHLSKNPGQLSIDNAYRQLGGKLFWPNVERVCHKFEVAGE